MPDSAIVDLLIENNLIEINSKPTKKPKKRNYTKDGVHIYNNKLLNPHTKKDLLEIQNWHFHVRIEHNSENEIHVYGCKIENDFPLNLFVEVDGNVTHFKIYHHKSKKEDLITTERFLNLYPKNKDYF